MLNAEQQHAERQREVAEKVAKATTQTSLRDKLATKETQLGELRASNAQIASDLLVKEEETTKLSNELREETAEPIKLGPQ
ncbi:hypothetical protein PDIDSM_8643 [Penicillium digitatum]|nr:hypothetical protein PDIDSM_8643 [Penicillium digitatum]